jgi:DNA-binding NarL/FixJ family response regulator
VPCSIRSRDFELISASLPDIGAHQNIDLVLLGNCYGQNMFDVMSCLKAPRPHLRIIVTGSSMDEQTILKAIAAGAKGYVDVAASPADFGQAIRIVSRGSVWVPRRVLSMFIERISNFASAYLSNRPSGLHGPRDASFKDAGRRAI